MESAFKIVQSTHHIDTNTFAIFDKRREGEERLLQFIWGKKDFRAYLAPKGRAQALPHTPVLYSEASGELVLTRLQYLNAYEWYDYDRVAGHGLALEEIRWRRGNTRRYLELPRNFLDIAVELCCREFDLERREEASAA